MSSLITHPRTHIDTHIYLSIYLSTFMLIIVPHNYARTDRSTAFEEFFVLFHQKAHIIILGLPIHLLTLFTVDKILLPRYVIFSTIFRALPFDKMAIS